MKRTIIAAKHPDNDEWCYFGINSHSNQTLDEAETQLKSRGYHSISHKISPTTKTLEKWSFDGIAKAFDGCKVEPDGVCPHGHDSWLVILGFC